MKKMKKIASLCAILAISANSYAQETDYSEGIVDYGYKKQILQTSDPFLN
ncbi:MAG: hypothetical protein CFH44_00951, partial [Proteobacteria bacterium]